MAEDTAKLIPTRPTDIQSAPTQEEKEDITKETSKELVLEKTEEIKGVQEEKKEDKPSQKIVLSKRIKEGKFKAVFRVIKEGKLPANLLVDATNKWYLIHYLVMFNKLKEMKVLVTKFDCDINITDSYMQTPLHMAALHGRPTILKYLAELPLIQIEKQDNFHATPLFNAIKSNFVPGFMYLYHEKGAQITTLDCQGFNAIHWAAFKNCCSLLQFFEHIPALKFDAVDSDGMTPIFRSISGLSYDSMKYLIKVNKADLLVKNSQRQTPEDYAQSVSAHPKIMNYLKKYTNMQKIKQAGAFNYLKLKNPQMDSITS